MRRFILTTFMPLSLLACKNNETSSKANTSTSADTTVAVTKTDTTATRKNLANADFKSCGLPYNELGRIMVLEYHLIGDSEDRWKRTPENFRKDLQMLYDSGYYPVSVHDIATGHIDIPAGTTPFALTFDDSSQGQFRMLNENGKTVIDPKCAVGVMEDFKKAHPGWPLTATFYVLPAIKPTLRLFAQPEYKKEKLEWLVKNGYEIGSHSWYHEPLGKLSDADVQKHLTMFVKEIKAYLPDYEVHSIALPLGVHAKNRALEETGSFEGTTYKHESVLLVGSSDNVSPYNKNFSRLGIERIQEGDQYYGPGAFIKSQTKHKTRFVSDGDPKTITAPAAMKEQLNAALEKEYKVIWN
ncbi:polysaccharide deacetylase family protein [Chitinophagaceae bacterium 26-R-25]|nr:polysaccharide deacetylase family protein [Chitinophagaceae bacterium 26-R-25]